MVSMISKKYCQVRRKGVWIKENGFREFVEKEVGELGGIMLFIMVKVIEYWKLEVY